MLNPKSENLIQYDHGDDHGKTLAFTQFEQPQNQANFIAIPDECKYDNDITASTEILMLWTETVFADFRN
jgi:hypothetical protein